MPNNYLFSGIYPILQNKLPKLFTYKIINVVKQSNNIGWSLAYVLIKKWGGHWVVMDNLLIGDMEKSLEECETMLQSLWTEKKFGEINKIQPSFNIEITPEIEAYFFVKALCKDYDKEIKNLFQEKYFDDIRVIRKPEFQNWVVQKKPCLSISINSELFYRYDIENFVKKNHQDVLIGKWVKTKYDNTCGEIIAIIGKVADHRQRLLAYNPKESTEKYIKNASDDTLVVKILTNKQKEYEYPLNSLQISIRIKELKAYKTNAKEVSKYMKLTPNERYQQIVNVANIFQTKELIDNSLITQGKKNPFFFNEVNILPLLTNYKMIRMGKGFVCEFNEKEIYGNLKKYGLYKVNCTFTNLTIGIISTLKVHNGFLRALKKELKSFNLEVKFVELLIDGNKEKIYPLKDIRNIDIEKAILAFSSLEEKPDIILAVLPNSNFDDDSNKNNAYHYLKKSSLRENFQTQVVNVTTIANYSSKMGNIVLGILAKTGNIPYILNQPIDFADYIVGIDIGRTAKKKTTGSNNIIAFSRIYLNDGKFLQYNICEDTVEGETLPKNILQSFFPLKEFGGKRVIIHRDGIFRGNEIKDLNEWAKDINSIFYLVEITKDGNPRIYSTDGQTVTFPQKGDGFYLNNKQAILVSSLPQFIKTGGTPQTLRITCKSDNITIQQALQSVLAMTLLHYGSLHPPKLPITIYYSDIIANLAINGIKPKNMTGNIPYWL